MQYQIGDFAKMAQISHKQLKYYEQCGLLAPARIDPDSGYRYYEAEQLRAVAHVRAFMSMGFTTAQIKGLLTATNYDSAFDEKQAELDGIIDDYRRKLALLSFYRDAISSHDFNQPYRAAVKMTPQGTFAMLRGRYKDVGALIAEWPRLLANVCKAGAEVSTTYTTLARFWDSDFEIENFDAELLLKVEKRGNATGPFEYVELTPVRAVSIIHRGGYELINEAYAFAYMWIDRNGYRASGLPLESYLCGPFFDKSEQDYVTELYIPIEPR